MALTDGLVGLWSPFLGASGYRLLDRSGRGNHGTLTNMDAWTDWLGASVLGKSGYSLDLDGSDDSIAITSQEINALTGSVSVAIWFRLNQTGVSQSLFGIDAADNQRLQAHCPWSDGNIYFDFGGSSGSNRLVVSGQSFNTTDYNFMVFTCGSRGLSISRNGFVIGSNATAVTRNQSSTPIFRLGEFFASNLATSFRAPIRLIEACVFSNQLTDQESRKLYQAGPGWILDIAKPTIGFVPVASGVTGTLAVTLDNATLSSSGTVSSGATGTLSSTLAAATLAASGTVADGATGSVSKTLDDATLSSSGTVADGLTATLSVTLDNATLAASGSESASPSGSLSVTLDSATLSSSGTLADGLTGTVSATLDAASLSASGTVAEGATGSVAKTLDGCTLASSGSFGTGLTAQLNVALASAIVSSSGTVSNGATGALSVQLASASLAASGTLFTPSTGKVFWVRVSGVWKETTPFVKVSGSWKQATPYIKIDGSWK